MSPSRQYVWVKPVPGKGDGKGGNVVTDSGLGGSVQREGEGGNIIPDAVG